jgi:hypothetical protein
MEQNFPKAVLQLEDLRANRRLLDAVGHLPGSRTDSAATGDVIKKFQMMDVHDRKNTARPLKQSMIALKDSINAPSPSLLEQR